MPRQPHGDVSSGRQPTSWEPGPPRVWSPAAALLPARPRASRCPQGDGAAVYALAVPSARKPRGAPARPSLARTETVSGERRLFRGGLRGATDAPAFPAAADAEAASPSLPLQLPRPAGLSRWWSWGRILLFYYLTETFVVTRSVASISNTSLPRAATPACFAPSRAPSLADCTLTVALSVAQAVRANS